MIGYPASKEPGRNNLASWFSNFVSWQGATNAHSLSSVIEERRSQGAKWQTKWVSYFYPAPKQAILKIFWVLTILQMTIAAQPQSSQPLGDQESRAVLLNIEKSMRQVHSLACRFTQEKHLQIFADVLQMQGWCYINKPDQIRWEYFSPLRKAIILNKSDLKIFKPDVSGNKYQRTGQEKQYMQIVYRYIMKFFCGKFSSQDDNFYIIINRKSSGGYFLILRSRGKFQKIISRIVLQIPENYQGINSVAIHEPEGDYTLIKLHSFVINPKFKQGLFNGKMLESWQSGF